MWTPPAPSSSLAFSCRGFLRSFGGPSSLGAAFRTLALGLSLASVGVRMFAQSTPTAVPPADALRPVLNRVGESLAGLSLNRWKAPAEVRAVMQRDIDSIQRDLASTLPPLLERANTPPVAVQPLFAVYRNVDALYDVLLRVSETATLAGPQADAASVQEALTGLEAARRDLGDAVLRAADSSEQELVSLRAAVAQAAAAAPKAAPPAKTVVDDGPAPSAKAPAKRKKKAAAQAPASQTSATPATPPE